MDLDEILDNRFEWLIKKQILLWMNSSNTYTSILTQKEELLKELPIGTLFSKIMGELYDSDYIISDSLTEPYRLTQVGYDFQKNTSLGNMTEIQEFIDMYNKLLKTKLKS